MGIQIGGGKVRRDWTKLASAAAETVVQALALGKDGFSSAISALFRALESLRGEDSVELRATRLIIETLNYAISATIATSELGRRPERAEAEFIINKLVSNATELALQREILLENAHLEHPASFPLFKDAASQIFYELRLCTPAESEATIAARFREFISKGLNRIRSRDPKYFSDVMNALSGQDVRSDTRSRAWDQYRARLIRQFEDEPLFGEDSEHGVTLGQVYQPLRCCWDLDEVDLDLQIAVAQNPSGKALPERRVRRHVRMLDELMLDWLHVDDKADRLRLVSGGPGSGKSTFAKHLAACLAPEPRWRVVFVPLQRLKGAGPLETRIDEYFRLQIDEPFDAETMPLIGIGRDEHRDWLIIFDGLDELAKEGSSSETAAQDFASALADWRGRLGSTAVRFLVLGRAPSMQEARRRLGLHGKGTIYVSDMVPVKKHEATVSGIKLSVDDSSSLAAIDQRAEFWSRWAAAKGLPLDPPEAMINEALVDLTKEPLLAYLLIFSGYASDRWQEAAENKNRIYQAIFDQIWERERTKPARAHLNDLGKEGFETLMQALGLAAWRGGGRTGDETTFTEVRDTFMRPDLLSRAKTCGAADLGNVALLFYTRKDEEGGRGYEFLHKSFGEYLTARGLFDAFQRWGRQMADPILDFGTMEFLRRWLKLSGSAPMTREIVVFLRNEARLQAQALDALKPWKAARDWVRIAERVVDMAVRDGIPAHETASKWREAEAQEINAEGSLIALLSTCALVAYPFELRGLQPAAGGWETGPVHVPAFEQNELSFPQLIQRLTSPVREMIVYRSGPGLIVRTRSFGTMLHQFPRLSFRGVHLFGMDLVGIDFSGANFNNANLVATSWISCDVSGASFRGTNLGHATFTETITDGADFGGAETQQARLDGKNLGGRRGKRVPARKSNKRVALGRLNKA